MNVDPKPSNHLNPQCLFRMCSAALQHWTLYSMTPLPLIGNPSYLDLGLSCLSWDFEIRKLEGFIVCADAPTKTTLHRYMSFLWQCSTSGLKCESCYCPRMGPVSSTGCSMEAFPRMTLSIDSGRTWERKPWKVGSAQNVGQHELPMSELMPVPFSDA